VGLIDILRHQPALWLAFCALLGLLVGSFLNVVALRLPPWLAHRWRAQCREYLEAGETREEPPPGIVSPPSHCPGCGHRLRPWENVPLLSYLLLRGRCRACGMAISWRYPLVEAVTGALTAVVGWHFGVGWESVAAWVFLWFLIPLTLIDLDHQLLPDALTLPLLWAGLLWSVAGGFTDPASAILGAAGGYLVLWSVYQLFKLATGKEGMGYGDFKLLAALGAWLGWQSLPLIVLLSSLLGAVVGGLLILLRGRDRQLPIPFGPFLAGAGWVAMLWGETLTRVYWRAFAGG